MNFSKAAFNDLQAELGTEVTYAIAVHLFYDNLKGLLVTDNSNVSSLLTDDYSKVSSSLYVPPPPDSTSALFDTLTALSGIVTRPAKLVRNSLENSRFKVLFGPVHGPSGHSRDSIESL